MISVSPLIRCEGMDHLDTSRIAHQQVRTSHHVAAIRHQVVMALHRNPSGLTGAEVNALVAPGANRRLSELSESMEVTTIGTRYCTITGRVAMIWVLRQ